MTRFAQMFAAVLAGTTLAFGLQRALALAIHSSPTSSGIDSAGTLAGILISMFVYDAIGRRKNPK